MRLTSHFLVTVVLVATALVAGCGKSPAGSAGGSASTAGVSAAAGLATILSAKVMPDPILRNRPVSVEVRTDSNEDEAVSIHYQWLVNGHRLDGQTRPTLDSALLKRGDHVSVEVIPYVGDREGAAVRSSEALVGNTPPSIAAVRLEPFAAHRGDRLHAVVEASDPDDDMLHHRYHWMRNQKPERETDEPELSTDGFQRGDVLVVEVLPSDGMSRGKPLASEPLVLANSPPKITSTPSLAIDPMKYQYTVVAVDPDADFLTYTLAHGPSGMTIDRMTGQLTWPRPSEGKTPQRVRVVVDDGHEGQAFQEFELTVTRTSAAVSP